MREVAHGHGHQLVAPQAQSGIPGREQVGPRLLRPDAAQPDQRHTDRRGGVQGGITQLVGDALRVVARLQALRLLTAARGQVGAVGERVAERTGFARVGQDRDRRLVLALGRPAVRRVPLEQGEGPVAVADRDDVPESTTQLQSLRAGGDRGVEAVGQVELLGQELECGGASGGIVLPDVLQRELVERHGFAVRARARGFHCRSGGVPQDARDVRGGRRVVGEHAGVAPDRLERLDHRGVQVRFRTCRHRTQYGEARDLVPEHHTASAAIEQPGGFERLDGPGRDGQGREQRAGDALGCARQQLQRPPVGGCERRRPGHDRVAHGLRQRGVRLGEDLADEERVARRPGVDACGVETVRADQLGDGRAAQRGELQPPRVGRGDEITEHGAQRVGGPDGLPVRQHEQQRQRADAAAQEPHEVQRRLVAPVQILDDEHPRPAPKCVEGGGEDLVLRGRLLQHRGDGGTEIRGDVAERAERTRSAQGVAHAPQHRYRSLLRERPQQDRLADAGLPGHQHHRTAAVGGAAGSVAQDCPREVALQQAHGAESRTQRCPGTEPQRYRTGP
jgi:hypothetical protein